jgi:hypothetical protein
MYCNESGPAGEIPAGPLMTNFGDHRPVGR